MSTVKLLRDYPTFGRVSTWNEWQDATVKSIPDYILPWFISNMVGFAILWIAIPYPILGRKIWGFLLVVASAVNTYQMLTNQYGYLEFGVVSIIQDIQKLTYIYMCVCMKMISFHSFPLSHVQLATPLLQGFIYSTFFSSPAHFVLPIALCQFLIGLVLMYSQTMWLLKASLTGAIIFFFGISFLGMGSAFPSSLVYASTMMICWPKRIKYKYA